MRKKVPRKVEVSVVGIQHRVTTSTRRMMAMHIEEEGPLRCKLEREKGNFNDKNAIKVVADDPTSPYRGIHVGYLRRQVAAEWAKPMDKGEMVIGSAWLLSLDVDAGEGELQVRMKTAG